MTFSDDVRVALRPFRVYREIAARVDERPVRSAVVKAGFVLLVVGAFVSLTAAGRLVAFHVASTMVFWAFAPLLQALAVAIASWVVAPDRSVRRTVALYFDGHAPWLFFLLVVSGLCVFVPNPYESLTWLVARGVLPVLLLGAAGWGGVLTYACFRGGLGLNRARAAQATTLFYVVYVGSIVGYYVVMNQLPPQFPGIA